MAESVLEAAARAQVRRFGDAFEPSCAAREGGPFTVPMYLTSIQVHSTGSAGNCDNVKVGDGQTKTYVAGTVTSISAAAVAKVLFALSKAGQNNPPVTRILKELGGRLS